MLSQQGWPCRNQFGVFSQCCECSGIVCNATTFSDWWRHINFPPRINWVQSGFYFRPAVFATMKGMAGDSVILNFAFHFLMEAYLLALVFMPKDWRGRSQWRGLDNVGSGEVQFFGLCLNHGVVRNKANKSRTRMLKWYLLLNSPTLEALEPGEALEGDWWTGYSECPVGEVARCSVGSFKRGGRSCL